MEFIEIIYGIIFISLLIKTSISDIKEGMIYNKDIMFFLILTVTVDVLYYAMYDGKMIIWFLGNFAIVALISLVLFFSNSFAGGDCKLLILLGGLYPARFYLMYNGNYLTLYLAVGIAVLLGYGYLVIDSVYKLIIGDNKISGKYVANYIISFFKSFTVSSIYIYAFSIIMYLLPNYFSFIGQWTMRGICILISYIVNRRKLFRKWHLLSIVFLVDVIASVILKVSFLSLNWENYIIVLVLLLCQMISKNGSYEKVEISKLKKGMILSSYSSILMQNSRVRGLPQISTEDLKSRLTDDEIESIKRWAKSRKIEYVSIVKKIPFAIFLELGFVGYFIIWSLLI